MYADVLYASASLVAIASALALLYVAAGRLARRGRHGEYARQPFTGGVELEPGRVRYFTDMVVFTGVFLLSEALALLVFLAPDGLPVQAALLLGALLVYLPPLVAVRRR